MPDMSTADEILLSSDKTVAVIDGSGVLADPAGINREELIDVIYEQRGIDLHERPGNWNSPAWDPEGSHDHSVAAQRKALEHYVDVGGIALGARSTRSRRG